MPELPEVEAIARTLRPMVEGRRIRCLHVFHGVAIEGQSPVELAKLVEGQKISSLLRHGKYLFLELTQGIVALHFRFDGQLIWFSNAKEMLRRANRKIDGVHLDLAFELDKGVLAFVDPRHLGRVRGWSNRDECKALRNLGVDALSKEFTRVALQERLARSKKPVKEFLLDQTKIAGIGNIYSGEALWHARIDPRRAANSIQSREAARLYKAIVSVLQRALECCLHPAPEFRDPTWWFQGIQDMVRVYQREGLACRRCKQGIERIEQGGRSTYCCLSCQK